MPSTPDYRSKALSLAQVRDAIAAHHFAEVRGVRLNLALDVHWQWTRFAQGNRRDAVSLMLESLRHFLHHREIGFFCIAVRENPLALGEHCHVLIHVPPDLQSALLEHIRGFLRGSKRHDRRALHFKATYNAGKLAYMLKGCTPPARPLLDQFNLAGERRGQLDPNQGVIYGKRLLISQALGPKARVTVGQDVKPHGPSRLAA
jgi:hypothetical protein